MTLVEIGGTFFFPLLFFLSRFWKQSLFSADTLFFFDAVQDLRWLRMSSPPFFQKKELRFQPDILCAESLFIVTKSSGSPH